jgi:hypothetical protein
MDCMPLLCECSLGFFPHLNFLSFNERETGLTALLTTRLKLNEPATAVISMKLMLCYHNLNPESSFFVVIWRHCRLI